MSENLAPIINDLYESVQDKPFILQNIESKEIILEAVEKIDKGEIRVAEPTQDGWRVNEWVKKSILLYFRVKEMKVIHSGDIEYWDKIPIKKNFDKHNIRVVPPAIARYGSYIEAGAILMPSYVNIGAYISTGTMVDTWATVGSCAQIGKFVHLSGGVGIGGVLEPPQAEPIIIEDYAFLGSRAIVVEGVRIQEGAVLGSGVVLTASTKIVDVTQKNEKIQKGLVPKNSVVIPGSLPKIFPAGTYHVPCALIIGKRKESTDKKTSLNDALRDFKVSV